MKCPDCGTTLTGVPFEGGVLMRCFKCGGFWADSFVLNKLTSKILESWRRISVSSSWFSGGKGVCPADGMQLSRYSGDNIPMNLTVSRCARCGKWWFPGESLFQYKPAVEAKVSYFRLWGLGSDTKSLLLPMMAVVILIVTAVASVSLVQKQQLLGAGAAGDVSEVAITYAGDGKAVVVFKSNTIVNSVSYKKDLEIQWKTVEVIKAEGLYSVAISGLVKGGNYYFLIGGKEYKYQIP